MKQINSYWSEWKITILILIGIFFLATLLRTINLNHLPIFADEAIYVRWSQVMRVEPSLRFLPLFDGKQPLFMWMVIPFFKIFSDPLVSGRVVSVLSGLGTFVGVVTASYVLFKSQKAVITTGLLWAISPFAVFFDRLALVDSMLAMFGIWTFMFAVLTAKHKRLDTAMLAGFALGGALLTKSPALFFVLLLPFTWIVSGWPKLRVSGKINDKVLIHLGKLVLFTTITVVIGYGLFNILRLGENFHMLGLRNQDYVYSYSHILTSPLSPLLAHLGGIWDYFIKLGPGFLLLLVILGVISNGKRSWRETVLLLIWAVVPVIAVAEFTKTMTARYILFTLPYWVILAGSSVLAKDKLIKYITYGGIALFVLFSLYYDIKLITNVESAPLPRSERSGYLEEWTAGTGIKDAASLIKQEHLTNPSQKIVVGTEGYFGTLPDGLQIYLNDLPEITVVGVGINLEEVPMSLIESAEAGNTTYLLINKSRLHLEPNEQGLVDVQNFRKAISPAGISDELTLFILSK